MRGSLTSSGGLAGIDVADNDDVDVSLVFLTVDRSCQLMCPAAMTECSNVPHGEGCVVFCELEKGRSAQILRLVMRRGAEQRS
jgi:hypothetical protein